MRDKSREYALSLLTLGRGQDDTYSEDRLCRRFGLSRRGGMEWKRGEGD